MTNNLTKIQGPDVSKSYDKLKCQLKYNFLYKNAQVLLNELS